MYKRLNELSFVIGLFFLLVSIILMINGLMNESAKSNLTFYTAGGFLLFGIFMVLTKSKPD
jgi:Na+(H+)/acetate symporter ActP